MTNIVILKGTIGKDIELKQTPNGVEVAKTSLATNESYKGNDGTRKDITTWHNLVAFGKTANFLEKYFEKGSPIFIQGKISNTSYDGTDGTKKYKSEIIIEKIEFVGGKKEDKPKTDVVKDNTVNDEISVEDIPF